MTSKRLVIAGAGGFGREIYSWVLLSPRWVAIHEITDIVFVDDHEPDVAVGAPIVGGIGDFIPGESDIVVVSIGSPSIRRQIVEKLAERGANFAPFVADSVTFGENVSFGQGAVVCPNVVITCDAVISDHAQINICCMIAHDVRIGKFATLSPVCNLTGGVIVSDEAFLGASVTVVPGVLIGEKAYVGAGSLVTKDLPASMKSFGNPARVIGIA